MPGEADVRKYISRVDKTLWVATSRNAPFEEQEDVGLDSSLYEPPALLARYLAKPMLSFEAYEAKQEGREPTRKPGEALTKRKRDQYAEELQEIIEDEREDAEMPEGYPSSELLAGMHAHISRYYASVGCMGSETEKGVIDPLPDMQGTFAPSALVALCILVQENVRYQLASAPKRRKESNKKGKKARIKELERFMEEERSTRIADKT